MNAILIREKNDLLTVMRREREARKLTHLDVDAMVGLGSGHYGKIERMGADWGKQAFRLTQSIVNILDLFDLQLIVVRKGSVECSVIPRDVRLIPEAPPPPLPQQRVHGYVDRFVAGRKRQLREEQKNTRRTEVQRAEAGGATC
jgi:hypothetical protein